jgi:ABC-type polysaccharide/polyol phosphate export permease
MVGVIDGLRWSLVDGPPPPLADLVSLVTGVAILLGGIVYFQRASRQIADRI